MSPLGLLPIDLALLGMPACRLRVSPVAITPVVGAGTTVFYQLPIPWLVELIGLPIHDQALVPDRAAGNAALTVVSDALGSNVR